MNNLPMIIKQMGQQGEKGSTAAKNAKKAAKKSRVAKQLRGFFDRHRNKFLRTGEVATGAGIVGGLSALTTPKNDEDNRKLNTEERRKLQIKRALIGSTLGGVGTGTLAHAGLKGLKAQEKATDTVRSKGREAASKLYEVANQGASPKFKMERAEQRVYDDVYGGGSGESFYQDYLKSWKNNKARENFTNKYMADSEPASFYEPYKGKFFGAFRGTNAASKQMQGAVQNIKDIVHHAAEVRNQALAHQRSAQFSRYNRQPFGVDFSKLKGFDIKDEAIGNDERFRASFKKVVDEARADAAAKNKGGYFNRKYEQGAGASAKGTINSKRMQEIRDVFGPELANIKTKKEFTKLYKQKARQLHPDINRRADGTVPPEVTAKMTALNNAKAELENSEWFSKLAGIEFYKNEIYKVAFSN